MFDNGVDKIERNDTPRVYHICPPAPLNRLALLAPLNSLAPPPPH